jgi:chemotaxis methyl-accepting protein methylase
VVLAPLAPRGRAGEAAAAAVPRGLAPKPERPEPSPFELALFADLVEERCGAFFPESRVRLLTRALWQRASALRLGGFSDYYRHLLKGSRAEEEWGALVELLLNRETGFFRHLPSFEALARDVLPELARLRARSGVRALTAWSAGCATGQEAYSLAMVLLDGHPFPPWEVKVAGTDLSAAALERARRGRYRAAEVETVPARWRERFFRPVDGTPGSWEASPALRAAVEFGRLNLARPADYWVGTQDVLFCQNVLL